MPLMRSNARSRARSRLATSKPVNVMFSNGLGVCKLGNAGSRSICKKKTYVPRKPGAFATGYVKPFNSTTSEDNKLNFKTNIKGATIKLVGDVGGIETILIDTTGNITVENTKQYTTITFDNGITSLSNGIAVTNVKLTLTGGKINPNGGWNINNVSHTVKIPDFTIDIDTPSIENAETTYDGTKIIVTFDESITSNGPLNKSDYTLDRTASGLDEEISSVQIVGGKLQIVPKIPIVTGETANVQYTAPSPAGNPGSLQDAAGNLVGGFTQGITSTVGTPPIAVVGNGGPPVTGSTVNYPNTNQILLEFTKPISSSLSGPLAATDFTIGGVTSAPIVTSVQITSGKVLLTLSDVIVFNDTSPVVSYTGVATGNTVLKSTDNLVADDFASLSVYNNIPELAPKNATFDDTTITIEYNRPVIEPAVTTDFLLNWTYSLRETSNGDLKGGAGSPFEPSAFQFVNGTIVLTRAVDEGNGGGRWPAAFIALDYVAPSAANEEFTDADGNIASDTIRPVYVTGSVPRSLSAVCDTTATPAIITLTYSGKIASNTTLRTQFNVTNVAALTSSTPTDVTVTSDGKVKITLDGYVAAPPSLDNPDVQYIADPALDEMKTTSGVAFISDYCAGFGINYNPAQTLDNQGQPNVTVL